MASDKKYRDKLDERSAIYVFKFYYLVNFRFNSNPTLEANKKVFLDFVFLIVTCLNHRNEDKTFCLDQSTLLVK